MKKPVPFGKYLLTGRINVGGMAEVFMATARGVDGFEKQLAIKRILPSIAADQDFIRMFVDEAKIAARLTHPNIAQIYDLGKVSEAYFIAMEYVAGLDLRAIFESLRRRGRTIPVEMTLHIMSRVCEALDYAHSRTDENGRSLGIVHRDVSPQNVLCSFDGDVKIIDFGIAKAAFKATRTETGYLKGKFGYMSPEQVVGHDVDHRCDIFAAGTVLWEMLNGKRLFLGSSDYSTLERVRKCQVPRIVGTVPGANDELEAIVMKALSQDPVDRFQSAAEMSRALQQALVSRGALVTRADVGEFMAKTFPGARAGERNPDVALPPPTPGRESTRASAPKGGPGGPPPLPKRSGPRKRIEPEDEPTAGGVEAPSPPPEAATGQALPESPEFYEEPTSASSRQKKAPVRRGTGSKRSQPVPYLHEEDSGQSRPVEPSAPLPAPPAAEEGTAGGRRPGSGGTGKVERPRAEKTARRHRGRASKQVMGAGEIGGTQPITRADAEGGVRRQLLIGVPLAILFAVVAGSAIWWFTSGGGSPDALPLRILTEPGGAAVSLGGVPQDGVTPLDVAVSPGRYAIRIEKAGFYAYDGAVDVSAEAAQAGGGSVIFQAPLRPAAASATVKIVSEPPGAKVLIDENPRGRTPVTLSGLDPNRPHVLRLDLDGFESYERAFSVSENETRTLSVPLGSPPAVLEVVSSPPGAAVYVDGEPVGRSPATVRGLRAQGTYRVRLELAGFENFVERVAMAGETRKEVRFTLRGEKGGGGESLRRAVDKDAKMGFLRVSSRPWAHVWIDGRDSGHITPVLRLELEPGAHEVSLRNPRRGCRKDLRVRVRRGETTTISESLKCDSE